MATGATYDAVEVEYFARLRLLMADGSGTVVRTIFDQRMPNVPLNVFLANEKTTINRLRSQRITNMQYNLLYPNGGKLPSSENFDMTLIICLLRNLRYFGLDRNFSWNALPQTGDTSVEADLYRLQILRHEVNHMLTEGIKQTYLKTYFQTKWTEIEQVLLRLNSGLTNPVPNLQQIFDSCKNSPLNSDSVKRLQAYIEEWQEDIITVCGTIDDSLNDVKNSLRNAPWEIPLDPYAIDLYQKALKDGIEKDKSIRVNIVGNYKQGKTSLTRRLLGQEVRDITSTNGIEIEHYKLYETGDERLTYEKVDDTKSEYLERIISVAQKNMTEMTTNIHNPVQQNQDTSSAKRPVDNSSPLEESVKKPETSNSEQSVVSTDHIKENEERKKVLSKHELETFSKSVKEKLPQSTMSMPISFDVWDFGGQFIFYATHTIFLSKRAIYLLVFDLSLDLESVVTDDDYPAESSPKDVKHFLQFWMQSIHAFVGSEDGYKPKVILVGTHKDKVKGNAEEKEKYIEQYFENVRQLFDGTDISYHIHNEDFAVDNTDTKDSSFVALEKAIVKLGKDETNVLEIPAKWIHLEKSLREMKHLKLIALKAVLNIDEENEFPLGNLEQIKMFLRFHHGKGTFVYFDEEPISEYVVLDPQFLVDAFKSIITSERFCKKDPKTRPLWNKLLDDARLEKELIDILWANVENRNKSFFENKDILVSFLTKHHIISEATTFDEATNTSSGLGWYVVPSMLKDHSKNEEIREYLEGKQQTVTRLVILFDTSSIIRTVYHRVVAALIARWTAVKWKTRNLIFTDLCVVRLNMHHAGIANMKTDSIELIVISLCPSNQVDGMQADEFRRFSEAVILHEFEKRRDTKNAIKPYQLQYRCNDLSHGTDGSVETYSIDELDGQMTVPCPDSCNHGLYVTKVRSEWFQDSKNPIHVPKMSLNNKQLGSFTNCLGENWELLGIELGLTNVEIDLIIMDNPGKTIMKIYNMLQKWSDKMADAATVDVLVNAIQKCSELTVDWDKLRNIVDEIKCSKK